MAYQRYTKELLSEAVDASFSVAGVLRHLNLKQAGGTQAHVARRIKAFGIDTAHFTGQAHGRGKASARRIPAAEILVLKPDGSLRTKPEQLRRAMLEMGVSYVCACCGCGPVWQDKPLTLEADHEDGNWLNNCLANLRFLCPNCHSQTRTFRQYGKRTVPDN